MFPLCHTIVVHLKITLKNLPNSFYLPKKFLPQIFYNNICIIICLHEPVGIVVMVLVNVFEGRFRFGP